MIIHDIPVEILQFTNLFEFLKPTTSHYILRYKLDCLSKKSLYYCLIDGSQFVLFAYCIDQDFVGNVKIENGRVCSCTGQSGTTIVVADIVKDSLLQEVIEKFKIVI